MESPRAESEDRYRRLLRLIDEAETKLKAVKQELDDIELQLAALQKPSDQENACTPGVSGTEHNRQLTVLRTSRYHAEMRQISLEADIEHLRAELFRNTDDATRQ